MQKPWGKEFLESLFSRITTDIIILPKTLQLNKQCLWPNTKLQNDLVYKAFFLNKFSSA